MFRADFTIGPAAEVSLIEYARLSLSPQFSFEKVPRDPYKRIFLENQSSIDRSCFWQKGKIISMFFYISEVVDSIVTCAFYDENNNVIPKLTNLTLLTTSDSELNLFQAVHSLFKEALNGEQNQNYHKIVQNKFLHLIKNMIEHPSCRNFASFNHRKNKAVHRTFFTLFHHFILI